MTDCLQLLVFRLANERYAISVHKVERILRMVAIRPVPNTRRGILGIINVHGVLVPVVSLRPCLGLPERPPGIDDRLVLVHLPDGPVALVADQIEGVFTPEPATVTYGQRIAASMSDVGAVVKTPDGLIVVLPLTTLAELTVGTSGVPEAQP